MSRFSPGVQAIVDDLVDKYGDVEITEENSKAIYNGEPKKVSELTPTELLQYALLMAHQNINELIGQLNEFAAKFPNRESRRKKGIVLP